MVVGYLYFMNPAWFWACPALLSVPVVAHLWGVGSGRRLVFPATRLITRAQGVAPRWRRLRRWGLLALRCAVLMFIVAAFARPVWSGPSHAMPGGQADRRVTVMVLDRSASMNRVERGVTLFDEARRRLIERINRLDPDRDRVGVVLLDANPSSLEPAVTADFQRLVERLERVGPTHQTARLEAAVGLAVALADRSVARVDGQDGGAHRDAVPVVIEWFSDFQKGQFAERWAQPIDQRRWSNLFHQAGQAVVNHGLFNPTVRPARPVLGQPATVAIDLLRFGVDHGDDAVVVTMAFEGRRQSRSVRLAADTTARVEFTIVPTRRGAGQVRFGLGVVEPFALDDRAGLGILTAAARRVVLFSTADVDDHRSGAYHVARALSPGPGEHGQAGVDLVLAEPRNLSSIMSASDHPAALTTLVLVEAGRIDTPQFNVLRAMLKRGVGVLWVVDSAAAAESYDRFVAIGVDAQVRRADEARSRVVWRAGRAQRFLEGRFDQPPLSIFEGSSRAALLDASFHSTAAVAGGTVAATLLSFADGSAALTEQRFGPGRLLVLGVGLSPSQSGWVKGVSFVPLLHELVRYLGPVGVGGGVFRPGDVAVATLVERHGEESGPWSVQGPDSTTALRSLPRPSGAGRLIRLGVLDRVGRYAVVHAGASDPLGVVFVAVDPAESDLRVDPSLSAGGTGGLRPGVSDAAASVARSPVGLWPLFVAIAAVLAAVESIVAALNRP